MFFQNKLTKGLRDPARFFYQLTEAERVTGLWNRAVLLVLASMLIFGISTYTGIGTEILSKEITQLPISEFEAHKALFAVGQIIWGLFYAALVLFVPSLFFWTLTDTEYKKLIVVQMFVLLILLVEKLILIPFQITFGLDQFSSPFSLGVIAQYLSIHPFFVYFLASITVFKIWSMALQYKAVKLLSDKNSKILLLMIISINLAAWLFSALIAYIEFEKVL
ncbi:hypothetical protein CVD25_00315 [Bacillus canaveralius]|uniref:Yip1 domain-containing protein n=1 Tax=Bacillus canaveralius TaxID=1403243 RepID=A0A2N5GQC4_9BACI|nr:hypothetical protein [Bacillus canaveralius]PLR85077.1 hypothetical protein CU635_04670 [Bacillus canaveralius]PLS00925.1 hypothetical protein CVD25_00315 [Bacillus canaveralius]